MDQINATQSDKYIVNNHGSIVKHLQLQSNWIEVSQGDHLRLMASGGALATNLIASRVGDDLVVLFDDGTSIVFMGYFACPVSSDDEDADSCSVTLAGDDEPYVVPAGAGYASSNAQVIYHQGQFGEQADKQTELDKQIANADAKQSSEQDQLVIAASEVEPAVGPGFSLLPGIAGGGLVAGAIAGGGSSSASVVTTLISGSVTMGPVLSTHGLSIYAYDNQGKALGSARVKADGSYDLLLSREYTGYVLLKAVDANTADDYMDEARQSGVDLKTDLRALVYVIAGRSTTAVITPITELAVLELGLSGGDAGQSAHGLAVYSANQLASINASVARAMGLGDVNITTATPKPTVDSQGNQTTNADAYGNALAAISGIEHNTNQSTLAVLNRLKEGIEGENLTSSMQRELLAGARTGNADSEAYGRAIGLTNAASINSSWQKLSDMRSEGSNANLTADDISNLGIDGVSDDAQLAMLNQSIKQLPSSATDSLSELQNLASIIDRIQAGVGAGQSALTKADFITLGLSGVDTDNEASTLASRLSQLALADKDTLTELQALATLVDKVSRGDASLESGDFVLLGVNNDNAVNADNIAAARNVIASKGPVTTNVTSLQADLNGAVSAANTALQDITNATADDSVGVSYETFQRLAVTGVDASNIAAINSILKSGPEATAVDSFTEIQNFVDAYNATKASADGDASHGSLVSQAQLQLLAIPHVDDDHIASLVATSIARSASGVVADYSKLSELANNAKNLLDFAAEETTATAPTLVQLQTLGVNQISADNLALFQHALQGKAAADIDEMPELDSLLQSAKNQQTAITKIVTATNNSQATDLSVTDYTAAGLTGVTESNLSLINSVWPMSQYVAPASAHADELLMVTQQTWLQNMITVLDKIYHLEAGTTPRPEISQAEVTRVGLGSSADGLRLFHEILINRDNISVTGPGIQQIIDAIDGLSSLADGNASSTLPLTNGLTQSDYQALGMTALDSAIKVNLLNQVVDGVSFSTLAYWLEVEKFNQAIDRWFADSSQQGLQDPLTLADINLLGFGTTTSNASVTVNNIAAVRQALDNFNFTATTTLAEIKTTINTTVNDVDDAFTIFQTIANDDKAADKTNFAELIEDVALYQAANSTSLLQTLMDTSALGEVHVNDWASLQTLVIAADYTVGGANLGSQASANAESLATLMLFADALSLQSVEQMFTTTKQAEILASVEKAMDLIDLDVGAVLTQEQALSQQDLLNLGITDVSTNADVDAYNSALVAITNGQWHRVDTVAELNALAVI